MPHGRSDLADLTYSLAVAKHRNFCLAGVELGVSASALGHSLKGLEDRLGVRLINRTRRRAPYQPPGEALVSEVFGLNRFRDAPAGRIRLNVPSDAASLLLASAPPTFADRYPKVVVDIAVTNSVIDVTHEGFDAGIRYGGTVPEDRVAQRLSADVRWGRALDRPPTSSASADRCIPMI